MILNGNTFINSNKVYPRANLAQWGYGGRDMGTYELGLYADQLWSLESHPYHNDYFYIKNCIREGWRIAKWGSGNREVGAYGKEYYDDQMWKFVHVGDGFYRYEY